MTIKSKLIVLVVICLSIIGGIMGAGSFVYLKVGSLTELKEGIFHAVEDVQGARVVEKQYLQFRTDELKTELGERLKVVKASLEKVAEKEIASNWTENFSTISSGVSQYGDSFASLVQTHQKSEELISKMDQPIVEAEKSIENIVGYLAERIQDLLMEGETLSENENEISKIVRDCNIFLFHLKDLQQQYLMTGNEELLLEFEELTQGQVLNVLDAFDQYAKMLNEDIYIDAAKLVRKSTGSFLEIAKQLQEVYREEEVLTHTLDENGNQIAAEMSVLIKAVAERVKSRATIASYVIVLFASIGSVLFVIVAFSVVRGILKLIGGEPAELAAVAKSIAAGDLTVNLELRKGDTESLFASMKNMVDKLKTVVADVQNGADNVASGSQEMSMMSQEVSEGATAQAANVEEVSASMEQMSANISQNTDNSTQTEKIALQSASDARDGGEAVSQTVQAMKNIVEKISIIREISRQTNLLALNAAIEAARAGEAGKGFAVVASEVRKLAERSQAAATEISDLSASSVEVAEKAGHLLERIVPDIQKTAQLIQEISAGSTEQNAGAGQVNQAIQQLDTIIQQNASASEKMATTSGGLASQSMHLKDVISFFDIGGNVQRQQISQPQPQRQQQQRQVKALPQAAPSQAPAGGLGLDLDLGSDGGDDDFETY
jgi:methyl-accepting chemotaxis protein